MSSCIDLWTNSILEKRSLQHEADLEKINNKRFNTWILHPKYAFIPFLLSFPSVFECTNTIHSLEYIYMYIWIYYKYQDENKTNKPRRFDIKKFTFYLDLKNQFLKYLVLTRYFNWSSLCSQTVVRWARIVSKIRFTHMSQNEYMPISIGFHVPIVVGVQQHGVFIPLHLKWQINPWCY